MGKKAGWYSALKRIFLPRSPERITYEPDRKIEEETKRTKKKKGLAKFSSLNSKSFFKLFREPSSVEKILDEAEREHKLVFKPLTSPARKPTIPSSFSSQNNPPIQSTNSKLASQITPYTNTIPILRNANPSRGSSHRAESSAERNQNTYAVKIQAAYKGYAARKSFRSRKRQARFEASVAGPNAKRQMLHASKHMQNLVRIQYQIHSRRTQMLGSQTQHQARIETGSSKCSQTFSRIVSTPYSSSPPPDAQSDTSPWWWNWHQLSASVPSGGDDTFQYLHMSIEHPSQLPLSNNPNQGDHGFDIADPLTPRSSKSIAFGSTRQTCSPQLKLSPLARSRRPRASGSGSPISLKDDESLASCPPFSTPHYMTPTASAKARSRDRIHMSEGRRLSFSPTQSVKSYKTRDKVSAVSSKASSSSPKMRVDSTPKALPKAEQKPFNVFV